MQHHNIIITLLVTLIQVQFLKGEELNQEKSTQPIVRRTFGHLGALGDLGGSSNLGSLGDLGGSTSMVGSEHGGLDISGVLSGLKGIGSKEHAGLDIGSAISGSKNIGSNLNNGHTDTGYSKSTHANSGFDMSNIMNLVKTGTSSISNVMNNFGSTNQKQITDSSTRNSQTLNKGTTDRSSARNSQILNNGRTRTGRSIDNVRQSNTNSRSSNTGSSQSIPNNASDVVTNSPTLNQSTSGIRNNGVGRNQDQIINIYNVHNSNQGASSGSRSTSTSNSSSNGSTFMNQSSHSSCSCTKTCSGNSAVKCTFKNGAINCVKSQPICPAGGGGSCNGVTDPDQCYCDPRTGGNGGSCGNFSDPQRIQNSRNSGSSRKRYSNSKHRNQNSFSDDLKDSGYSTGAY